MMTRTTLMLLFFFLLPGCMRNDRLYNLQTGELIPMRHARSFFSGTGRVEIDLPSGEQCRGEYVTMSGGSAEWGSVFGSVYGPGGTVAGSGSGYGLSLPTSQKGRAIAAGNRGTVIQCEYVVDTMTNHGHGACKDNKDGTYQLMF